jgi:hypothetical protein
MSLCCDDVNCEMRQVLIVEFPRYDCPMMCDDGCVYGDDCENGTPLPPNIRHEEPETEAQRAEVAAISHAWLHDEPLETRAANPSEAWLHSGPTEMNACIAHVAKVSHAWLHG